MSDLKIKHIDIANDWSKSPTGRYRGDGASNATDFRKKFLNTHLKNFDIFEINLDGTDGYGSSFLDEAFSGLIRDGFITKSEFYKKFKFTSTEDPSFIDEINEYVEENL